MTSRMQKGNRHHKQKQKKSRFGDEFKMTTARRNFWLRNTVICQNFCGDNQIDAVLWKCLDEAQKFRWMELQNAHQSHCAQEQQNTISARETPEEDEVNHEMHDDLSLVIDKDTVDTWEDF